MKKQTKEYIGIFVGILGLWFSLAILLWSLDNKQYLFSLVSILFGNVFGSGIGILLCESDKPKKNAKRSNRK